VLQVDQQTTIDFSLHPLGVITTVEVRTATPLLDRKSASLGTSRHQRVRARHSAMRGHPKCAGREPPRRILKRFLRSRCC
jgi:hypothetical protein